MASNQKSADTQGSGVNQKSADTPGSGVKSEVCRAIASYLPQPFYFFPFSYHHKHPTNIGREFNNLSHKCIMELSLRIFSGYGRGLADIFPSLECFCFSLNILILAFWCTRKDT